MEPRAMAFVAAMKDFFGLKEGQVLTGFAAEIKTLDEKARQAYREMLEGTGKYKIV